MAILFDEDHPPDPGTGLSREVDASEFRSSAPPTVHVQGTFNGGSIQIQHRPYPQWDWVDVGQGLFDGSNTTANPNTRPLVVATGKVRAQWTAGAPGGVPRCAVL